MADGATTFDWFTLGVAAVGAASGIGALGATWGLFVLSGPRLKLTTSLGVGGNTEARFYLSVLIENRGRTAASIPGVSLRIEGAEDQHIPIGMLQQQGTAWGPDFRARLEPFSSETWLIEVDPIIRTLREQVLSTRVRAFCRFGDDEVTSAVIDLADIAAMNAR